MEASTKTTVGVCSKREMAQHVRTVLRQASGPRTQRADSTARSKTYQGSPFNLPGRNTDDDTHKEKTRDSGSSSISHLPSLRSKTETPRPWRVHPSPRLLLLNPRGSRRRYKPNVQCFRHHNKGGLLSDTRPSLAPIVAICATAALANS